MAIAYDNSTLAQDNGGASSSLTFSHTCSGSNRILFVMGHDKAGNVATVVTGVTYNGVAMTQVNTLNGSASANRNDRAITLWYLVNPASGAHNVVVSASETVALRFHAVSYTGARQINQPDGSDTSTGDNVTSISTDITTTADYSWMLMFGKETSGAKTFSSSTGDTMRLAADAGGHFIADSGAITPAVANTMTLVPDSGNIDVGALAVSFSPIPFATISDTVKVGDVVSSYKILSATIVDIVKVGDVVNATKVLLATIVDTVKVGDIIENVTALWHRVTKNSTSYNNVSKNSTSFNNQSKNSSSWTNQDKNIL